LVTPNASAGKCTISWQKVRSTLDRVHDISAPESTCNTMAGILEALAVKEDGEDPLVAAVHR
jgi:hypothetical protein